MRRKYRFQMLGVIGSSAQVPSLYTPAQVGVYSRADLNHSTINCRTVGGGAYSRWGYTVKIPANGGPDIAEPALQIIRFRSDDGSNDKTIMLTQTNACELSAAQTSFSYITESSTYTGTEQVDSIDAATKKVVTFEGATTLSDDGVAAGDYFVLSEDLSSSDPDTSWTAIASIDSDTQLTLSTAYEKAVTSPGAKNAVIRKVYTGPTKDTTNKYYDWWGWAIVADKLCFCNENDNVQYYSYDNTYATALDSTNAKNFKYCIEYADRLVLANTTETGSEDPKLVKWSKNGDPTDWTDSTAGSALLESSGTEITGLAKSGGQLVVFFPHSFILGYRTGVSTSPIAFQDERKGVGLYAPYSLVYAGGKLFFAGSDNFYALEGTHPIPIGGPIRDELFYPTWYDPKNIASIKGLHNPEGHEVWWFVDHSQFIYAYDYHNNIWNVYNNGQDTSGYLHGGGVSITSSTDSAERLWTGCSNNALSTNRLNMWEQSYKADDTAVIQTRWLTKKTDFSDQDPEAAGKWKTVYRIRLYYRDLNTDSPFTMYIRVDDGSFSSISTNTVGTASNATAYTDFYTIKTGNIFDFKVLHQSSTKKTQLLGMDVLYELNGACFEI